MASTETAATPSSSSSPLQTSRALCILPRASSAELKAHFTKWSRRQGDIDSVDCLYHISSVFPEVGVEMFAGRAFLVAIETLEKEAGYLKGGRYLTALKNFRNLIETRSVRVTVCV